MSKLGHGVDVSLHENLARSPTTSITVVGTSFRSCPPIRACLNLITTFQSLRPTGLTPERGRLPRSAWSRERLSLTRDQGNSAPCTLGLYIDRILYSGGKRLPVGFLHRPDPSEVYYVDPLEATNACLSPTTKGAVHHAPSADILTAGYTQVESAA